MYVCRFYILNDILLMINKENYVYQYKYEWNNVELA